MFKKVLGWILVIFGTVGIFAGILAYFGGSPFIAALKIFGLSLFIFASGLGLARRTV